MRTLGRGSVERALGVGERYQYEGLRLTLVWWRLRGVVISRDIEPMVMSLAAWNLFIGVLLIIGLGPQPAVFMRVPGSIAGMAMCLFGAMKAVGLLSERWRVLRAGLFFMSALWIVLFTNAFFVPSSPVVVAFYGLFVVGSLWTYWRFERDYDAFVGEA